MEYVETEDKNKIVKWMVVAFINLVVTVVFGVLMLNSNSISSISYSENNDLDYRVYLKDNEYYENEYVQDMEYISSLINYIDLDYNYSLILEEKMDIEYSYNIMAKVKVYNSETGKLIYEKDETLVSDVSDSGNLKAVQITKDLKIKYQEYNDLVKHFKNEYNLFSDSKLEVIMNIHVNSSDGMINKDYSNIVEVPLAKQVIGITKIFEKPNASSEINIVKTDWFKTIINALIFGISLLIFGKYIIKLLKYYIDSYKKNYSLYKKTRDKILNEYDRIIVNTNEVPSAIDCQVINIAEFSELVDVADNLNKPILYTEVKQNKRCKFCIINDKEFYVYQLRAEKLDKKR